MTFDNFGSPFFRQGDDLRFLMCCDNLLRKGLVPEGEDRSQLGPVLRAQRMVDCISEGAHLLREGFEPVFVFDGRQAEVMSNLSLLQRSTDPAFIVQPMHIRFLRPLFAEAYQRLGYPFEVEPSIRPSHTVFQRSESGWREVSTFVNALGDVEVVAPRAKPETQE